MTIAEYLEQPEHNVTDLAEATGVSQATLRNARNGVQVVSYKLARRIEKGTGGAVTIREICDPSGVIEAEIDKDVEAIGLTKENSDGT
jgi:transcriptional regulator with XRE-family HTH domain